MKRKHTPVILHLVTWYPSSAEDTNGIFIRRHIELLATNTLATHIVAQKAAEKISVLSHLKSLTGILNKRRTGSVDVIQVPEKSHLYDKFFWRYKKKIEQFQLARLINKYHPSLLHLHVVYGFGKDVLAIKERFNIPFIVSEHMAPFPFEWLPDKEQVIVKPMQQAEAVVAVGAAQAKQIEDFTGVKPVVIHNVVDAAEFFYNSRLENKANKGLQIVLVGIYDSRKGSDYLLTVLPEFIKEHTGSLLHLVGDAEPARMELLQKLVNDGGLQQSVKFHGKLNPAELCRLYQSCDFYVCSSEWESFGVSVLEALFTGLPVLSTNCGGVLEFMNPDNGLLIENDRGKETLLKGLSQMVNQLPGYNREKISAQAIHDFSNEQILKKYNSIYKKILDLN